jgi:signal transduction histidine kinase
MRRFFVAPRRAARAFALWFFISAASMSMLAAYEYQSGLSALSERSRGIETLLAERLAQHDAHLTAIGTLVRMFSRESAPFLQGLAENIIARYPRITDIAVFDLTAENPQSWNYGSVDGPMPISAPPRDTLPHLANAGETEIRPSGVTNSYEIYKLVVPGRMLRMRINADALLDEQQIPAQYALTLGLGQSVLSSLENSGSAVLKASNDLTMHNQSQPLRLTVTRGFGLAELLPPQLVVPLLAALAAAIWLVTYFRYANDERRRQEHRAELLEQDAKLAHAARVNALGEMASGIAHELAQPIAAILAQSQAARRALTIARPDIVEKALEGNIRDAKRAGDILGRMRAYISGAAAHLEEVSLFLALSDAVRLIEADLAQRNIELLVIPASEEITVTIDIISFQQVVLNLIRNAADAAAPGADPRITVSAERERNEAVIKIADNGPGIDPSLLDRVFEPFFTTKQDGMGLGLPLSSRLIEKMDGSLSIRNEGGACFMIRLPSGASNDLPR